MARQFAYRRVVTKKLQNRLGTIHIRERDELDYGNFINNRIFYNVDKLQDLLKLVLYLILIQIRSDKLIRMCL